MSGNKPFSKEEFQEYVRERNRLEKKFATARKTVKVMYKSLCPACEYNASHGRKIIYDCPNCKIGYWNNCSRRQWDNGQILDALRKRYGNIEWAKAFEYDGSLYKQWRRHENRYEQEIGGGWVPKDDPYSAAAPQSTAKKPRNLRIEFPEPATNKD